MEIADAVKVKGFAPPACKTEKIDVWVLAELSRRDVVPAIWLPTRGVRAERERARWRLRLVRHRTALMNRIHATLAFAHPYPVSDPSAADRRCGGSATSPGLRRRSSWRATPDCAQRSISPEAMTGAESRPEMASSTCLRLSWNLTAHQA